MLEAGLIFTAVPICSLERPGLIDSVDKDGLDVFFVQVRPESPPYVAALRALLGTTLEVCLRRKSVVLAVS